MRAIEKSHLKAGELLAGKKLDLRLALPEDYSERYLSWLQDPAVNQYLETRWTVQNRATVTSFVETMMKDPASYLLVMLEKTSREHIGNIKLGPINPHHAYADVSYFVGEKKCWGQGYATEAIQLVCDFGFQRLRLHRIQAGVQQSNTASERALKKAGFQFEGRLTALMRGPSGWEDHLCYYRLGPT
jgi:RimJ/RimL family protein N-acetyltransferase